MLRIVIQAGSGTQGVWGGGTCSGQRGAEWKESIHEPLVRSGEEKGTKNEGVMSPHGPGWVMNTGGSGLAKCTWNK